MVTPEVGGAFTGGISPAMLKSMGCEWALAGHSERRTINKETDEYINAQCRLLIENGMNVILCIGESLEEFEKQLVGPVCEVQLKKGLAGITKEAMSMVTIAYEPVWAIGTGNAAEPSDADQVQQAIGAMLTAKFGSVGDGRVLYGGSVKPDNTAEFMSKPSIDGLLVGGASLSPDSFADICRNAGV